MFRKMEIFSCLLLSVLLIAGCSNEAASTKPSLDNVPVVEQPSDHQKRPTDHDKTHRGKPGADVKLLENVVHRLEPGVAAEVVPTLTADYQEGLMTVSLTGSDGLHILEGETHYTFPLTQRNEYPLPLRLLASEPGRYYIQMQITVDQQGRRTARALSAIVQVGDEGRTETGRQKAADPGDVIRLPASETIIQH